ncbi:MAG: metalloregulator ArsR/SmtB family transcription factor [Kiritimatiellae bacterium]|nr:metalloregulator ArsR/SmtB family transcription factor [Kiritimatiellia bacterium]
MSTTLRTVARVVRALADKQRLRILLLLEGGELCVCQITAVLGLATSTISKHLAILDAAGLVESKKEGRWIYYRLTTSTGPASPTALSTWLIAVLRNDETIRADRLRLDQVKKRDLEDVCRELRRRKKAKSQPQR